MMPASDAVPARMVPIEEQIACIERELGFRERLYPRWVKLAKLTQENADVELARIRAVLASLRRIQQGHDHAVPDAKTIREGERARVLCLVAPLVHSSKMVALARKLADPA